MKHSLIYNVDPKYINTYYKFDLIFVCYTHQIKKKKKAFGNAQAFVEAKCC